MIKCQNSHGRYHRDDKSQIVSSLHYSPPSLVWLYCEEVLGSVDKSDVAFMATRVWMSSTDKRLRRHLPYPTCALRTNCIIILFQTGMTFSLQGQTYFCISTKSFIKRYLASWNLIRVQSKPFTHFRLHLEWCLSRRTWPKMNGIRLSSAMNNFSIRLVMSFLFLCEGPMVTPQSSLFFYSGTPFPQFTWCLGVSSHKIPAKY